MKLYLVRHGASTGNTPGNLIGQSDHPLSALGEAQARAVAARLAPLGPLQVYSSDLPRALATAERIEGAWRYGGGAAEAAGGEPDGAAGRPPDTSAADAGPHTGIITDPRLREIHLGELEGGSWKAFTENLELAAALESDPFHTPLPGGESLALLRDRAIAAVRDIVAAAGPETAACLVSHDGPIRAIINHYLGVPADKWWVVTTTHGGLSLLEFGDGWVDLRFVNDTAHLAAVDYGL